MSCSKSAMSKDKECCRTCTPRHPNINCEFLIMETIQIIES
jgi:hypothetical protein